MAIINHKFHLALVIPSYHEPGLITLLECLSKSNDLNCSASAIIVINHSEADHEDIKACSLNTVQQILDFKQQTSSDQLDIHIIDAFDLDPRHAGVGLARRIGMDKAYQCITENYSDGVIVNLDSDCTVDPNYMNTIASAFMENRKLNGASIYYEHRFDDINNRNAIVDYELHLRLYVQSLRRIGYPFAFQTVGSSMACRASAYRKQGGMNRRKAGEDFYFIQKLLKLGHYSDINSTTVRPSNRQSNRVPFGTGKAVTSYLSNKIQMTYNPKSYELLSNLLSGLPNIWARETSWQKVIFTEYQSAFKHIGLDQIIQDANKNSKNYINFRKRFYAGLDGFKIMKYMHYCRDNYWPNVEIQKAVQEFLGIKDINRFELLNQLRILDRNDPKYLDATF